MISIDSFLTVDNFLAIVSLIGMAFTSRHEFRIMGFSICSIGNILWLGWILLGNAGNVLLFSGYFVFNVIGVHDEYTSWKKLKEDLNKYVTDN